MKTILISIVRGNAKFTESGNTKNDFSTAAMAVLLYIFRGLSRLPPFLAFDWDALRDRRTGMALEKAFVDKATSFGALENEFYELFVYFLHALRLKLIFWPGKF